MMMREHRTAEEQREGSCRARELKKDRGEEGRKIKTWDIYSTYMV